MNKMMKKKLNMLQLGVLLIFAWCSQAVGIEMSAFCKAQTPMKYILESDDESWT